MVEALERDREARAVARADHRRARAGGAGVAAEHVRPRERRLRPRPEVPAGVGDRAAAGARRARDVARDAARRWPAAGSTTRSAAALPATRSTRPGPSPTSRRCSTTTRCWPARTCTAGRCRANERFRAVCCETLDWALREMQGPEGGFCSALDADSEGVEGKFYVWTRRRAARRARPGGPRRGGDRLLRRHRAREFRAVRAQRARGSRARARRSCPRSAACCSRRALSRVRPGLDDKRLTSWNALMISALAEAGAALGREDYLDAAVALRVVRAVGASRWRRAPVADLEGRSPRISTPTSRITRSCSRR